MRSVTTNSIQQLHYRPNRSSSSTSSLPFVLRSSSWYRNCNNNIIKTTTNSKCKAFYYSNNNNVSNVVMSGTKIYQQSNQFTNTIFLTGRRNITTTTTTSTRTTTANHNHNQWIQTSYSSYYCRSNSYHHHNNNIWKTFLNGSIRLYDDIVSLTHRSNVSNCENLLVKNPTITTALADEVEQLELTVTLEMKEEIPTRKRMIRQKIHEYWRMMKRCVKLAVTVSPMVFFYPFYLLAVSTNKKLLLLDEESQRLHDAHQMAVQTFSFTNNNHTLHNTLDNNTINDRFIHWYYQLCLSCVESSGACIIKCMQWAGSRPDLFGIPFCNVFSKLQDHTTPHSWKHTQMILEQAYGPKWYESIRIEPKDIIGSGCIGQVYKGHVKIPGTTATKSTTETAAKITTRTTSSSTNTSGIMENDTMTSDEEFIWKEVAIKVLHPYVRDDVDADLDLMRFMVRNMNYIPFVGQNTYNKFKWLNLEGIVNELSNLLQLQLDLRYEGENLLKFRHNFQNNTKIYFPKLIQPYEPKQNILIEEFCYGIPIVKFCQEHYQTNPQLLSELCKTAIQAVCQMIFLDNFVHGDLHPGNVLVTPDGKQFILFDVGIVNEYSDADHQLIVNVLAAFVFKDGRKAGRLMIDASNSKLWLSHANDRAVDEELYIDKIEELTIRASTKGYLMENLGTYITYICDAASRHHVMMNPAFISAALAVKVQEGIALAMDPSVKIPSIAIPIILNAERKRYVESTKSNTSTKIRELIERVSLLFQNNNNGNNKNNK